jgi:hypothetical protein
MPHAGMFGLNRKFGGGHAFHFECAEDGSAALLHVSARQVGVTRSRIAVLIWCVKARIVMPRRARPAEAMRFPAARAPNSTCCRSFPT